MRGLYDGLAVLGDRETGSYWNHITGESFYGPRKGAVLEGFALRYTTVAEELARDPGAAVVLARLNWRVRLVLPIMRKFQGLGFIPPHFRLTMGAKDTRLPTTTMGLGVWTAQTKRFYPMTSLQGGLADQLDGQGLRVTVDAAGIPQAEWAVAEGRPLQMFTRWYGFAYTFPGCEIYAKS